MTSSITILSIEDQSANQLLIRKILRPLNVNLLEASSAENGFTHLKTTPVDLILLDMQLPEMTGFEAAEIIRNHWGTQIPIIAITAYSQSTDLNRCLQAGCNKVLTKPIDIPELISTVKEMTSKPKPFGKIAGWILPFLLCLSGCLAHTTPLYQSQSSRPIWITTPPPSDAHTHYFVGMSTQTIEDGPNISAARQSARDTALQNLLTYLHVSTKTQYTAIEENHQKSTRTFLQLNSPELSLSGIYEKDHYYEIIQTPETPSSPKNELRYYCLIALPQSSIDELDTNQRNRLRQLWQQLETAKNAQRQSDIKTAAKITTTLRKELFQGMRPGIHVTINKTLVTETTLKAQLNTLSQQLHNDCLIQTTLTGKDLPQHHIDQLKTSLESTLTHHTFQTTNTVASFRISGQIGAQYSGIYAHEMKTFKGSGNLMLEYRDTKVKQWETLSVFDATTVSHIGSTDHLAKQALMKQIGHEAGLYFTKALRQFLNE